MSQIPESGQVVPKPVAKRSRVERLLVWGGIVVLLAIVAVEWTSRRNYEMTLDVLDTAIQKFPVYSDQAVLADDVASYVRGFAFRGDLKHGTKKYQTFQWPSLFRFYKLIVLIDGEGVARTVDAYGINPAEK